MYVACTECGLRGILWSDDPNRKGEFVVPAWMIGKLPAVPVPGYGFWGIPDGTGPGKDSVS